MHAANTASNAITWFDILSRPTLQSYEKYIFFSLSFYVQALVVYIFNTVTLAVHSSCANIYYPSLLQSAELWTFFCCCFLSRIYVCRDIFYCTVGNFFSRHPFHPAAHPVVIATLFWFIFVFYFVLCQFLMWLHYTTIYLHVLCAPLFTLLSYVYL